MYKALCIISPAFPGLHLGGSDDQAHAVHLHHRFAFRRVRCHALQPDRAAGGRSRLGHHLGLQRWASDEAALQAACGGPALQRVQVVGRCRCAGGHLLRVCRRAHRGGQAPLAGGSNLRGAGLHLLDSDRQEGLY